MEQLRTAGEFIWKHRFWFSLGLVVIFAGVTYPTGSATFLLMAKRREMELENAYKGIQRYTSGSGFPNRSWIERVGEKKQELTGVVEGVWEQAYKKQEKLMTWPKAVADKFAGKPFGSDLTDPQYRNEFLLRYRKAYGDYVYEVYEELKPLDVDESGKVIGVIDAGTEVVGRAKWTRPPLSMEAWYAQEQLWLEGALFRAIAKCNADAPSWSQAPVRKLFSVAIGEKALDAQTKTNKPTLSAYEGVGGGAPAMPGTPPPPGGQGGQSSDQGIEFNRYIEKTPQYRVAPVFVSMIVDQMQIPRVLSTLSGADFGMTIKQVNISAPPSTYDVPQVITSSGETGGRGGHNDPIYNGMQVDVWGQMRLFEMPPKMKAEYEQKNNPQPATPPANG